MRALIHDDRAGTLEGELAETLFADLRETLGEGPELPPPIVRAMDARVEAWERGRRLVMSFPAKPSYAGPTGFLQGGVIAAAFDDVLGPVAYTAAGGVVVSIALSVTFHRPLRVGRSRLVVEATLVEATRRLVFVRGEARDEERRLLATCTSELIRVDP